MKELSKRSDELSFHVPSNPMLLMVSPLTALINDQINSCEKLGLKCCKLDDFTIAASARLSVILGLGSKLYMYPGNMQRMLNKDVTRFMQSLPCLQRFLTARRRETPVIAPIFRLVILIPI